MRMSRGKDALERVECQRPRVGSKKSVQQAHVWPDSSQRGTRLFCARSVHALREHRKMARTPLAAFFNGPLNYVADTCPKIFCLCIPEHRRMVGLSNGLDVQETAEKIKFFYFINRIDSNN